MGLVGSLEHRKQLAGELKYGGDTNDSASMNIWLHKQPMTALAANGGKLPADLASQGADMSIVGTPGEIAGAAAAVEALEKADPSASLLTRGMAAVAGFKGAGAFEVLIDRKTEDAAGDSEQAEQA
ncbi:Protein of unknown function (DUF3597) [Paraburkholderia caribensis MBA4]|uniref:DUF3597 domain-containing protein n=2 Tax=Paraburkholderia caribensis TaxID=75105 RepID=A0A0P0RFM9_9BURK|nr:Protein of unknown function (DUF3597) [Paraburkholderia caribensis MBA4]